MPFLGWKFSVLNSRTFRGEQCIQILASEMEPRRSPVAVSPNSLQGRLVRIIEHIEQNSEGDGKLEDDLDQKLRKRLSVVRSGIVPQGPDVSQCGIPLTYFSYSRESRNRTRLPSNQRSK